MSHNSCLALFICGLIVIPFVSGCASYERQSAIDRGKEFQKNNLFDKAAAEYLRAVDLITSDDSAKAELLLLAGECQNYKNTGSGKEIFRKVLDLKLATENQKNNARLKIAYCLFVDGDYRSVVADMEKLIAKNMGLSPAQQAEAHGYLGWVYLRLKELDKAGMALRKAIVCKELPLDQRLKLSYIFAQVCLNQNDFSIPRTFEDFENIDSDKRLEDFFACYGILSNLTRSNKLEQSNEICDKIITDPAFSPTARQYALMFQVQNLSGLNRYEETIMKGNQFLAQYPDLSNEDDFTIRMCIGTAMMRLQRYDDAVVEFTEIYDLNTLYFSQLAQMAIGDCYLEQKKYDAALKAFTSVKELASLNSYVELLAQANRQINNIKEIHGDKIKK